MAMDSESYNGFRNWATWNVSLWLANDEPLYREKVRFARRTNLTPAKVEVFVKELLPSGTPDMNGPKDYEEVDWDKLCESWKEDEERRIGSDDC